MLRKLLIFIVLICSCSLSAQQLTPEKVERYTREWMLARFHRGVVPESEINAADPSVKLPAPEGKSVTETIVSEEEGPESEVAAVINPTDSNRIVAAVMKTGETVLVGGFPEDPVTIQIYYSHDFGTTWTKSAFDSDVVLVDNGLKKGGGDPVLAYDKDGTLHLTWIIRQATSLFIDPRDVTEIYHATSTDDGVSWQIDEEPVAQSEAVAVIDFETFTVGLEGVVLDKEWLVADNNPASPNFGNLYLFYTEITAPGPNGVGYKILGNVWNAATGWSAGDTIIPTTVLPFVHFSSPVVTPDGTIHLMVGGATLEDEFSAFYLLSSSDGGQTYGAPRLMSYWNLECFLSNEAEEPPCVEGIPAARTMPSGSLHHNPANDELYAIWYADGFRDSIGLNHGTDIYFTVSKDQGQSWSQPITVNTDTVFTTDSFIPSGVVDDCGDFFVTWYDNRADDGGTDYYGARYAADAESFDEEFIITTARTDFATVGQDNGGFGVGEYNTLLTTSSTLLPIWADGRSNDGDLNIRIAHIDKVITGRDGVSCTLTSTNSIRNDGLRMSLSPNPTSGPLRLTLALPSRASGLKAAIIDAHGRTVLQLRLPDQLSAGEHAYNLPVEGLPAATYFVTVASAERGRSSLTFVKQ